MARNYSVHTTRERYPTLRIGKAEHVGKKRRDTLGDRNLERARNAVAARTLSHETSTKVRLIGRLAIVAGMGSRRAKRENFSRAGNDAESSASFHGKKTGGR